MGESEFSFHSKFAHERALILGPISKSYVGKYIGVTYFTVAKAQALKVYFIDLRFFLFR